jgi:hypothetical protein
MARYDMICYAMLCYAVLCCAVLYCTVLSAWQGQHSSEAPKWAAARVLMITVICCRSPQSMRYAVPG